MTPPRMANSPRSETNFNPFERNADGNACDCSGYFPGEGKYSDPARPDVDFAAMMAEKTDMAEIEANPKAGDVPGALENLALTYENDLELELRVMTNLIEPAMIIVMAVGVGGLLFSILQALFMLGTVLCDLYLLEVACDKLPCWHCLGAVRARRRATSSTTVWLHSGPTADVAARSEPRPAATHGHTWIHTGTPRPCVPVQEELDWALSHCRLTAQ